MFILSCNLIGLVPGLESPTAVPIVPLGCALFTWFYYHYHGVRENGPVGYLAHFIGPQDKDIPIVLRIILPILMLPIEVFSHLARVMSLTVRLFANMFAGEMVTLVFFSLIPLGIPLVFEGLHIGVSVIQTYIFVLLAAAYLGEATSQRVAGSWRMSTKQNARQPVSTANPAQSIACSICFNRSESLGIAKSRNARSFSGTDRLPA